MSQFPRLVAFETGSTQADPSAEETFVRSKLDWREAERNREVLALHRDLLRLRRDDHVISQQDQSAIEGSVIGPEALALRWYSDDGDDRLLIINLGRDFDWHPVADPLVAAPRERRWRHRWTSEDPRYGGMGTPKVDDRKWHIAGHTAVLLTADLRD